MEQIDMQVSREFGRNQDRKGETPVAVSYLHVVDGEGVEWLIYADHNGGLSVSPALSARGEVALVPSVSGSVTIRKDRPR